MHCIILNNKDLFEFYRETQKMYMAITIQGYTRNVRDYRISGRQNIRHYHISGDIKHTSLSHLGRNTKRTRPLHYRRHKISAAITLQGDKYLGRHTYATIALQETQNICGYHITGRQIKCT